MAPAPPTSPLGSAGSGAGNSGGGFGPSQLAGDSGEQETSGVPGMSPDAESNALGSVVEVIRDTEQTLQSLAQQFPVAAPEIRRASDAVRAVLQRIVSSPGGAEPPAPPSFA